MTVEIATHRQQQTQIQQETQRDWKQQVIASFDRAATLYDDHAEVQQSVANHLAALITQHVSPTTIQRGTEIGCGTGFLTSHLLTEYPAVDWQISDASPQMVQRCQQKLKLTCGNRQIQFDVLDGEHLTLQEPTNLIASSLTFQWFVDLQTSIGRLFRQLSPGGWLCFSLLHETNFAELKNSFPALATRLNRPVSEADLHGFFQQLDCDERYTSTEEFRVEFPNLTRLLHSLKAIGANVTSSAKSVDDWSTLRQMVRQSDAENEPVTADYRVMFVLARKRGGQ